MSQAATMFSKARDDIKLSPRTFELTTSSANEGLH